MLRHSRRRTRNGTDSTPCRYGCLAILRRRSRPAAAFAIGVCLPPLPATSGRLHDGACNRVFEGAERTIFFAPREEKHSRSEMRTLRITTERDEYVRADGTRTVPATMTRPHPGPLPEGEGDLNCEVYCYSGTPRRDAITERFIAAADYWLERENFRTMRWPNGFAATRSTSSSIPRRTPPRPSAAFCFSPASRRPSR